MKMEEYIRKQKVREEASRQKPMAGQNSGRNNGNGNGDGKTKTIRQQLNLGGFGTRNELDRIEDSLAIKAQFTDPGSAQWLALRDFRERRTQARIALQNGGEANE